MARYVHNINWMDVRIGVYCRRSTTPRSSPSKSKSSKDEIVVLLDLVAFLFLLLIRSLNQIYFMLLSNHAEN